MILIVKIVLTILKQKKLREGRKSENTYFKHEVKGHSCEVFPVRGDVTRCNHISVAVNQSRPAVRRIHA